MSRLNRNEQEQMDRLVQFYADQENIEELTRLFEWYEPIVVTKREAIRIGKGARIDSFVKLEGGRGLRIGEYVHIASFAHLNIGGGELVLEDGSAVASGGRIITGGNLPLGVSMSAVALPELQVRDQHVVVVGKNAAILAGAILVKSSMGEGSILAAGAVAIHDVPPGEIWAGVPAKFLAYRPKAEGV